MSEIERLEADNRRLRSQMRDVIAEREQSRAMQSNLLAALTALKLEAWWMARQLGARGLPGAPGDAVDRAIQAADAAIAKAKGRT